MSQFETRVEVAAAIEEKKRELAELITIHANMPELSEAEELAVALHKKQCRWNHTDGCGWYYEYNKGSHDWNGYSHKEYLTKAHNMIKVTPTLDNQARLAVVAAL